MPGARASRGFEQKGARITPLDSSRGGGPALVITKTCAPWSEKRATARSDGLRPEEPVAEVAETGEDVLPRVHLAVHRGGVDQRLGGDRREARPALGRGHHRD